MNKKRVRVAIRPAKYLSPRDRQRARELSYSLRSAENVEEVVQYQKQLEELIRKASINKSVRERALALKQMDKAELKAKYTVGSGK